MSRYLPVASPALRPIVSDDDAFDTAEVPAAVVCARCGSPDCLGCEAPDEVTHPSGVIAIIPWERPIGSAWTRLWSTALAVSLRSEAFFGPITKGELSAPLRFSIACELIAVSSVAITLAAVVFAVIPGLTIDMMSDPASRTLIAKLFLLAIPGLTGLLIVMHVLWGVTLDVGARRAGARSHRSQALRFGMYSAGLDLMSSPIGLLHALITQGSYTASRLLPATIEVPSIASRAMLRHVYHLAEQPSARVRRFSSIVIWVVGVLMVIGLMCALVLAVLL